MATDPKNNKEMTDEQMEETAGGRIADNSDPRMQDDSSNTDASGSTDKPRMRL